jgi:hypothetical protein
MHIPEIIQLALGVHGQHICGLKMMPYGSNFTWWKGEGTKALLSTSHEVTLPFLRALPS